MLLAEGARSAVVPPQADRATDKTGIEGAESTPKQGVDEAAANEPGAVDAAKGLPAPIVGDAVVALEAGNVV